MAGPQSRRAGALQPGPQAIPFQPSGTDRTAADYPSEYDMELASNQIRFLRSLCHSLKPVVLLGANGLTPAVLAEIDVALNAHELIKIKVRAEDREARAELINGILEGSKAAKVQHIGHTLAIYRPAQKPVIALPKALKTAKPKA